MPQEATRFRARARPMIRHADQADGARLRRHGVGDLGARGHALGVPGDLPFAHDLGGELLGRARRRFARAGRGPGGWAADGIPVGYRAGEDVADLVELEPLHRIVRMHDDGEPIEGKDMLVLRRDEVDAERPLHLRRFLLARRAGGHRDVGAALAEGDEGVAGARCAPPSGGVAAGPCRRGLLGTAVRALRPATSRVGGGPCRRGSRPLGRERGVRRCRPRRPVSARGRREAGSRRDGPAPVRSAARRRARPRPGSRRGSARRCRPRASAAALLGPPRRHWLDGTAREPCGVIKVTMPPASEVITPQTLPPLRRVRRTSSARAAAGARAIAAQAKPLQAAPSVSLLHQIPDLTLGPLVASPNGCIQTPGQRTYDFTSERVGPQVIAET